MVEITNVLLYGMAGTGKTSTKHLICGWPTPEKRNSTGLAEGTRVEIRNVSGTRVQAGVEEWKQISSQELMEVVAATACSTPHKIPSAHTVDFKKAEESSLFTKIGKQSSEVVESETASSTSFVMDDISKVRLAKYVSVTASEIQTLISTSPKIFSTKWIYFIDSGGQPHFRHLLRLFVESTSLSIYVLRLSDGLDEYPLVEYYRDDVAQNSFVSQFTPEENFKYLVQSLIQSPNSENCRMLCIGTHCDQVNSETIEQIDSRLRQLLPDNFCDNCFFANIAGNREQFIFAINAIEGNSGNRKKVKDDLRTHIFECPSLSVAVPVWWYISEVAIEMACTEEKRKVLSMKECKTIVMHFIFMKMHFQQHYVFFINLTFFTTTQEFFQRLCFVTLKCFLTK